MATQVVNASLGTTPYRVTLGDDSHQWLSDVPAALGGADSGPSPHEILLSALGACTAITVAMYAQRKEWPLEGIDVQLNIVEERTKPEPFTHIRRDIRLAGDLDAEQRQRLAGDRQCLPDPSCTLRRGQRQQPATRLNPHAQRGARHERRHQGIGHFRQPAQRLYNSAALQEAIGLVPPGMSIELADISGIPLYNEDVYALGFPPAVERFREQIRAADALLFATPEYNYSMAGVLKNAIDWASRPPEQPFSGKPAAILGASAGRFGTARAQYHLRQTLVFLDVHPLNKPEVMISSAQNAFDAQGRLLDDKARELIQQQLQALQLWVRRLRG